MAIDRLDVALNAGCWAGQSQFCYGLQEFPKQSHVLAKLFLSLSAAAAFSPAARTPLRHTDRLLRASSPVSTTKQYEEIPSFQGVEWPEKFPFEDPGYYTRMDESPDIVFYSEPRFVTHIDDGAIGAIRDYYASTMHEGADVLDLCSSWISHLPDDLKLGRVVGVGMNSEELGRNERLSTYEVQDLNVNTKLPYDDASFDFVCNVVSVDYLTKPMEIFKEMYRVLRPGGKAIMSFSNRCFPTKAIGMWSQTDDAGHIYIVGSYFKFSADWSEIKAFDITESKGMGDPMYVVQGTK